MAFYLAVDTATEACSAAVWLDGAIDERFESVGRGHTQRLLPMVRELLAASGRSAAQLDGLACGIGPGSFAGVRVGVGVVKGLALARELPVVGVSSLAMLAAAALRDAPGVSVATAIDARMGELYFAAWTAAADGGLVTVATESVCGPAALPRLPAGRWHGAGSGWGVQHAALAAACGGEPQSVAADALPRAADALRLAQAELAAGRAPGGDALAPAYLRDRVALTLVEQAALRR